MAIDIKTLRIGSHILINGKRVCVCGIRRTPNLNNAMTIVQYTTKDIVVFGEIPAESNIEPIPITSDILKELGFEEDKTDIVKRVGGYFIYFHQINNLRWRVSLEEENCTNYGDTLCRYLHEAEAFLALHGVELKN